MRTLFEVFLIGPWQVPLDFVHVILTNCIEFNIPLYVNFNDFKAAFDSIRREFIRSSMRHYGLPESMLESFRRFSTKP